YDYWLGGKDNFAVDREMGEATIKAFPELPQLSRHNRAFLARAVRFLAGDAGIQQFLDVGTGLPTANNTHEVAQSVAPESRIVYVDNDPLVLVHARALLTSSPEGRTDYIQADLRDTDAIVQQAAQTLDLSRPVALMLLSILAHMPTYDDARAIVQKLMSALPSGSYLTVSDATNTSEAIREAERVWNESIKPPYNLRSPDEITGYFDGLELVEPGIVPVTQWRPDDVTGVPDHVDAYGGIGRKP
ncbi:MAG: SAM-dependent methyltransferase, partial [Actinomycetota bacterium]